LKGIINFFQKFKLTMTTCSRKAISLTIRLPVIGTVRGNPDLYASSKLDQLDSNWLLDCKCECSHHFPSWATS